MIVSSYKSGLVQDISVTGCEAVKEEGRTQMHNVTEKGFNKGPDRQYINKTQDSRLWRRGNRKQ